MAADPVAWFIGGGAVHSPEIARLLAYVATKGSNGIVEPGDLRVRQVGVPTTKVRVSPGAFVAVSRFPNASHQSYGGRFPTETLVDIQPTTSAGGRSDMIVARVKDPQYPPFSASPPVNRAVGPYVELFVVEGVSPTARTAKELNLGYPAVELARIDIPVSTGTIIDDYLVDLRRPYEPKEKTVKIPVFTPPFAQLNTNTPTWQSWPLAAPPSVEIPDWATHAQVTMTIAQLAQDAGAQAEGDIVVQLGNQVSPGVVFKIAPAASGRHVLFASAELNVTAMAGTIQIVKGIGRRVNVGASPGIIVVDQYSQVLFDVTFIQRAV